MAFVINCFWDLHIGILILLPFLETYSISLKLFLFLCNSLYAPPAFYISLFLFLLICLPIFQYKKNGRIFSCCFSVSCKPAYYTITRTEFQPPADTMNPKSMTVWCDRIHVAASDVTDCLRCPFLLQQIQIIPRIHWPVFRIRLQYSPDICNAVLSGA